MPLAYALLTLSSMDALSRDIIHTIREGLGMSRVEFARALGWAPSTISRWEAELHFRVAGRDRQATERSHAGWVGPVTMIAASLCILLAVGIPLMESAPTPARRERPRPAAVARPVAPGAPVRVAQPAVADAPVPVITEPALEARLEGVTLIGGKREATFRTPTDTLIPGEGARIGTRKAARIAGDGVELR